MAWFARREDCLRFRADAALATRSCGELKAAGGEHQHAQQQPTMLPAMDVGGPVGAGSIADGQLQDAQVEFGRAKEQIEIAERIEVAEITPVPGDEVV